MNFDEALAYLLSLGHETLTIKLGLKNTETLLEALGNSHNSFPAVQIAGTNGKGSTAAFLDSICRVAGIRTGLFTSPHLVSITERIKINGGPISEDEFARITSEVRASAEELVRRGEVETLPTFFEHVTAIALLAFYESKVELAILETGLGGRLDSTTAAHADVVAITQIAMDHEEYLGNSIAAIAAEKAAIIRRGAAAVIAPRDDGALKVILRQCEAREVAPILVGSENRQHELPARYRELSCTARFRNATPDGRCRMVMETPTGVYENVLLGLRGRHQIDNAAVAIGLAEVLRGRGFKISQEAIIRGLETAKHPGRLEFWEGQPPILFDGAHNPAAAHALLEYLDEFVAQPITMIFGVMREKRLNEMAAILFAKADRLILTQIDNPRAASLEELKAAVSPNFDRQNIHQASSISDAVRIAQQRTPANGLILITGSLYLVGEAQQKIDRIPGVAHPQASH